MSLILLNMTNGTPPSSIITTKACVGQGWVYSDVIVGRLEDGCDGVAMGMSCVMTGWVWMSQYCGCELG